MKCNESTPAKIKDNINTDAKERERNRQRERGRENSDYLLFPRGENLVRIVGPEQQRSRTPVTNCGVHQGCSGRYLFRVRVHVRVYVLVYASVGVHVRAHVCVGVHVRVNIPVHVRVHVLSTYVCR